MSTIVSRGARSNACIPWTEIIGLRNILAHDYQRIEHERLWVTAQEDVPALRLTVSGFLKTLDDFR